MQTYTENPNHYSYPLITWGPTLMGAAVAIVTSVMLNMLGVSLGMATAAASQTNDGVAVAGYTGIAWVAVANLIALAFGAWVAARSTHSPDHHQGTLQGVAVWAVTSLFVVYLASSALSGATSTLLQTAGAASSQTVAQQANQGTASSQVQNAADNAQAAIDRNQPAIQQSATTAAKVTSAASFGTFLAMVLGLVAAIWGARAGARHPQWTNRPRYGYSDSHTTTTSNPNFRTAA